MLWVAYFHIAFVLFTILNCYLKHSLVVGKAVVVYGVIVIMNVYFPLSFLTSS